MVELLQSKDKHGLELCFVNILSRFEIKYASQLLNAKMLFAFEVAHKFEERIACERKLFTYEMCHISASFTTF